MIKKYWRHIIAFSLPIQVVLVQIMSGNPAWVEEFYATKVYSILSKFLRLAFGSTRVPIGQLVFYALVLALVIGIARRTHLIILNKAQRVFWWKKTFVDVLFYLSCFYFFFMTMWGLNYYRAPVAAITQIPAVTVSVEKLERLCLKLIEVTNTSRAGIKGTPPEFIALPQIQRQALLQKATVGYAALAKKHPELIYEPPAVKSVFVPELMSSFRVGGIYFPFTGEANVNMDQPAFILPATICHEMAHQIGFASEDEANYIAFLTCRANPDPVFQYSGNLTAMRYALNRLYSLDSLAFQQLEKKLNPTVKQDLEINRQYWESFPNPFLDLTSGFYDLFLKANGQQSGIQSYSQMVELLLGEFEKNNLEYGAVKPVPLL